MQRFGSSPRPSSLVICDELGASTKKTRLGRRPGWLHCKERCWLRPQRREFQLVTPSRTVASWRAKARVDGGWPSRRKTILIGQCCVLTAYCGLLQIQQLARVYFPRLCARFIGLNRTKRLGMSGTIGAVSPFRGGRGFTVSQRQQHHSAGVRTGIPSPLPCPISRTGAGKQACTSKKRRSRGGDYFPRVCVTQLAPALALEEAAPHQGSLR